MGGGAPGAPGMGMPVSGAALKKHKTVKQVLKKKK